MSCHVMLLEAAVAVACRSLQRTARIAVCAGAIRMQIITVLQRAQNRLLKHVN